MRLNVYMDWYLCRVRIGFTIITSIPYPVYNAMYITYKLVKIKALKPCVICMMGITP